MSLSVSCNDQAWLHAQRLYTLKCVQFSFMPSGEWELRWSLMVAYFLPLLMSEYVILAITWKVFTLYYYLYPIILISEYRCTELSIPWSERHIFADRWCRLHYPRRIRDTVFGVLIAPLLVQPSIVHWHLLGSFDNPVSVSVQCGRIHFHLRCRI